MALPPLRDLSDRRDVKGGSPRTPTTGIPMVEYQQYANGSDFWKIVATTGWSLLAGVLLAWFTAWQGKGVTTKEMQEYDKEYSLYAKDKESITQRNQTQDNQIGTIQGIQQSNIAKMGAHEAKFHDEERDITELQNKVKLFADYIDALRNPKK